MPGRLGPDPATRHSPSTWTPPAARPTVWPRQALDTTATPDSEAITRCWPRPGLWGRHRRRADVSVARGPGQHCSGAAHFLRETVSRVRYSGARGQLTVRADRGCYAHAIVAVCREMDVRYSITICQHKAYGISLRPYPRRTGRLYPTGWTAPPRWPRPPTPPSRARPTPCRCGSSSGSSSGGCSPRPVPNLPSSSTTAITAASPTGRGRHGHLGKAVFDGRCITDREGPTLELEADHRRHAEIENAIRDLKYGVGLNHLPSGRFAANAACLAVQVMAHNLARWTARLGLGEQVVTTKTLRRRFFSLTGRLTHSARRLTLHLPQRWPWEAEFSGALARLRALPFPA